MFVKNSHLFDKNVFVKEWNFLVTSTKADTNTKNKSKLIVSFLIMTWLINDLLSLVFGRDCG